MVDGCYGWWVGGLFAVVDSLVRPGLDVGKKGEAVVGGEKAKGKEEDGEWEDSEPEGEMLFNRVALQEYVLLAAQHEKGGLRDKPGK